MMWLNFLVLCCIMACALSIAFIRDMLVAVVLLGCFSFLMALIYVIMGAPDVAITEAAVGGGMSTILMLAAVCLVGREEKKAKPLQLPALILVGVLGVVLIAAFASLPEYGSSTSPSYLHVSPHYLKLSPVEIGIANPVTSILASYRGYDTLGETTVVFTAAMSVLLLLQHLRSKPKEKG